MEKKTSNFLVIPPTTDNNSISLLTPQIVKSTGSATGNPRNKCALKPGHSLMDWIRLGNSGIDLSGTCGRIVAVTSEELTKHNTRNDAWMAIQGVVYNVTKYMDFHPGGVEELMRGVGTDATKLFNETHAWVNYGQLLHKCRIGPLTKTVKVEPVFKDPFTPPTDKTKINFIKPPKSEADDISPRLDWIQKREDITLYIYTKQFCNPGCLIRYLNCKDNSIEIWVFISQYVYKFDFKLQGRIAWPAKGLQIFSESGKIEVKFNKHEEHLILWNNLGKHKRSKILADKLQLELNLEFQIYTKEEFTNDSFAILMKNENVLYNLPVGYHLTIEGNVNNTNIRKPYTPVPKNYINNYVNLDKDRQCQNFLIKQYSYPNSFSKFLCNAEKYTTLSVSLPKGNFNLSSLVSHRNFCFLAAGSGLTPFLGLMDHLLKRNTNRIEVLKLFYFNKTTKDIWCHESLTNLSLTDERFKFINILSNADENWTGSKGRVSLELLHPIINETLNKITYIAVCGPNGFNVNVEKILKELKFPYENLFIF